MNTNEKHHRAILQSIAHKAMLERGLLPDFSTQVLAELERLQMPVVTEVVPAKDPLGIRDMQNLPWASIDNDDSRDLDQLTVAEAMPGGKVKIMVAVADVDSLVKEGSAIDEHARHNTTFFWILRFTGRMSAIEPNWLITVLPRGWMGMELCLRLFLLSLAWMKTCACRIKPPKA